MCLHCNVISLQFVWKPNCAQLPGFAWWTADTQHLPANAGSRRDLGCIVYSNLALTKGTVPSAATVTPDELLLGFCFVCQLNAGWAWARVRLVKCLLCIVKKSALLIVFHVYGASTVSGSQTLLEILRRSWSPGHWRETERHWKWLFKFMQQILRLDVDILRSDSCF